MILFCSLIIYLSLFISCSSSSDITPECELNNTCSPRYENRSDSETAYAK